MAIAEATNKSLLLLLAMVVLFPCACSVDTSTVRNASETERQALLGLRSQLSDPSGALDSWRDDSVSFCDWRGVFCNTQNAPHVVSLNLSALNITGSLSPSIAHLRFIHRINMSYNQINGYIPPEIGNLTRLRILDLSMNSITGVIPPSISFCARLQVIRLKNNSIEGEIPQTLGNLQFLQEIILSNNKLGGTIPSGIGLLPRLQFLFLSGNNLYGSIPEFLGSSSALSMVVVQNNSLTGGIPSRLANCSTLYYLDLMSNKLTGKIPSTLFNSTSLLHIDLSDNGFSGRIPSTLFNSKSLLYIDLSENGFSGPVPSSSLMSSPVQHIGLTSNNFSGVIPATLGNLSSLIILLLADNNLQGGLPERLARIPRLQVLDLSYNNLSGRVPRNLFNSTSLTYLSLGENKLTGTIPRDIGYTLPNIQTLVMEENHFHGPLPVSLVHASKLQSLELRHNAFTGVLPSYWSLPSLTQLDLGANNLETVDWSSLSSTTSFTMLQIIYLDNNNLQGSLPNSIGNLPSYLQQLFLTENNFSGSIPPEIGNLGNLTVLQLQGNRFSGSIPETLGNLGRLFVLSLANNILSGRIPESIGNLESLSELYLQENNLTGSIPPGIIGCKNLVMLNLSHNILQGSIPPEILAISSLSKGLDMSYNHLTGPISSNVGGLINLGFLDISNNHLFGVIPDTLGECILLESIHLEMNFLYGSIPLSLSSLRGITMMDLSQNNLSGEIPKFLETFSSLELLNLSFNNLDGVVPMGGAFSNSSKVFLEGNKMLCTSDPILNLPHCKSTIPNRKNTSYILLVAIPLVSAVIILGASAAIILLKMRFRKKKDVEKSLEGLKKFSYFDIAKATNEFSSENLLGAGRFGCVYKGIFNVLAHPVAVKVFKLDQLGATKNFLTECEVLRSTRHRNLIQVISLCSGSDQMGNEFKALILEYMGNGNLEIWLHSKGPSETKRMLLDLGSRIMIAIDIAAALDYLHNWCTPPLVHCDLKPSNVLLDDDMVAHVRNFGLAKFLLDHSSVNLDSSTNVVGPRGSVGYIAPEYGMGCEISTAGDIYSYGVILLEMITGKHPTNDMFKDGLNLHNFVEHAFPYNISEILDSSLIPFHDARSHDNETENQTLNGIQNCIKSIAQLGLMCSVESPKDRPAIQDVYTEIIAIKEKFLESQCQGNGNIDI